MKKIFLLFVYLPFLSFAVSSEDLSPSIVRVYTFNSMNTLNDYSVSSVNSNLIEKDPFSVYCSIPFGLSFSSSTGQLSLPSNSVLTNSSYDIKSPVRCTYLDSGSVVYANPIIWPSCSRLFSLCVSLYRGGYRGNGAIDVSTRSSICAVNFNFPVLVSDVLSSTNTVFRQLLLSNLSSIHSSVINIDSGVSALAPEVSNIRSVNTAILTNVQNSAASLVSIDEAVDLLVDRVGEVLEKINSDPYVTDFTNAVLALSEINGSFTPSYVDHLLSSYAGLDSPFAKALFALSVKQQVDSGASAEEFIKTAAGMPNELVTIGQYLSQDVVDALIGDYSDIPTRGGKAVNTRTSIKAQLSSWREDAKKQLQDWQTDLRQQLQDWKTSDETGYLNVRGAIDNVASNQFRYFDNNSPDSSVNFGVGNLTNATERIVRDSSLAVTNAITDLRDFLNDNLFGPNANDIGVRITFPIYGKDHAEVGVHDESVYQMLRGLPHDIMHGFRDVVEDGNFPSWSVHVDNYNEFLDGWLDEWRRWVGEDTFYQLAQSFYDFNGIWQTNALPFFADYRSSFIKEGDNFYKSAFDIVRHSSQSNLLSRLCFYGLSSEPTRGNFFDFFTSFALLQSELSSSLLDAKDMIDDLSSSSSWLDGLSVFEASRQVVDSIPSKSQIEQMVTTATDGTNLVLSSSTDLLEQFGLITNLHSHAFSVFKTSSTSLPDHIVLFRFKTSLGDSGSSFRDVSIPVGTVPNLWLVIRLSIAFGICAVNLILFPKFLLKLALLFMPLFKKSLPFLNASA